MVHENAETAIDPACAGEFEAAVAAVRPHFEAAEGCVSFALERSIDNTERYLLVVGWQSVEAHMVDFHESQGFQAWSALASPFFTAPPSAEHVVRVI